MAFPQPLFEILLPLLQFFLRNQHARALHLPLDQLAHHEIVHRLRQDPRLDPRNLFRGGVLRHMRKQPAGLALDLAVRNARLIHPHRHLVRLHPAGSDNLRFLFPASRRQHQRQQARPCHRMLHVPVPFDLLYARNQRVNRTFSAHRPELQV